MYAIYIYIYMGGEHATLWTCFCHLLHTSTHKHKHTHTHTHTNIYIYIYMVRNGIENMSSLDNNS